MYVQLWQVNANYNYPLLIVMGNDRLSQNKQYCLFYETFLEKNIYLWI